MLQDSRPRLFLIGCIGVSGKTKWDVLDGVVRRLFKVSNADLILRSSKSSCFRKCLSVAYEVFSFDSGLKQCWQAILCCIREHCCFLCNSEKICLKMLLKFPQYLLDYSCSYGTLENKTILYSAICLDQSVSPLRIMYAYALSVSPGYRLHLKSILVSWKDGKEQKTLSFYLSSDFLTLNKPSSISCFKEISQRNLCYPL